MKKALSLLLVLAMVLSMVPAVFAADESYSFDDLENLTVAANETIEWTVVATESCKLNLLMTGDATLTIDGYDVMEVVIEEMIPDKENQEGDPDIWVEGATAEAVYEIKQGYEYAVVLTGGTVNGGKLEITGKTYPGLTEDYPIDLELIWEYNEDYSVQSATVTVPAKTTYYFQAYISGKNLTINDGEPTLMTAANPRSPVVFSIVNNSDAEATYALSAAYPPPAVGSWGAPEVIENIDGYTATNTVTEAYYYTWTAVEDGTVILDITDGANITVNNYSKQYKLAEYAYSEDWTTFLGWTVAENLQIPVSVGDVLTIEVVGYSNEDAWTVPETTYTLTGAFEPAVVAPEYNVAFGTKQSPSMELLDIVYFQIDATLDDNSKYDFNDEEFLSRFRWLVWKTDDNSPTSAAEATIDASPDAVAEGAIYVPSSGRIRVKTPVIACEMGDALTWVLAFENTDGTYTYGQYYNGYKPTNYLYGSSMYGSGNTVLKNLAVTLLNYGASAQNYFDYNVESLMNADLTEAEKTIVWDGSLIADEYNYAVAASKEAGISRNNPPVTKRTIALNLVSTIDYVWSFTLSGIEISGTPQIYYWTQEQYESLDVLTLENAISHEDCVSASGNWYGYYEGRAASEMFEEMYGCLVVQDTSGNTYYSGILAASPQRYCYMNNTSSDADLVALTRSIVVYGDAARAYFG